LAATYTHSNPGDLFRVRQHEGCTTDDEAVAWLIARALAVLKHRGKSARSKLQINSDSNSGYSLVVPFDELEYEGRGLHRLHNDHAQLRDPFNPMSGRFAENVRRQTGKDGMDELRESMRSFGWLEELPAIKDERGVVLVGHRRLAVAAELGIQPVVRTVRLGDGDEGDAKRFALAVASNLGAKAFTPEERKDIAEYLYGEREWTEQRIAEALRVSQRTISRDLEGLDTMSKPPRPKGGRPKGSTGRPRKLTPEQQQTIVKLHDEGKSWKPILDQVGAEFGVSQHAVQAAIRDEDVRRAAIAEERERQHQAAELAQQEQCRCPNCGNLHPVVR
jgi:ParB-like chromosome segregation protein Spo0J